MLTSFYLVLKEMRILLLQWSMEIKQAFSAWTWTAFRILVLTPYVGNWVCCWFSFLLQEVFLLFSNPAFQIPIQSGKHSQTCFKNKFIRTPTCFMGKQITIYNCFYHQIHICSAYFLTCTCDQTPPQFFFISQPTVKRRWLISFLKPEKCYVCGYYC